jgi:hypothetical protein
LLSLRCFGRIFREVHASGSHRSRFAEAIPTRTRFHHRVCWHKYSGSWATCQK